MEWTKVVVSKAGRQPIGMMAYSHDGFGLGHLRRNTNIAARLIQDVPGSNVLLVIGCPRGAFFDSPPGVDFIKIPSIVKVDTGVHRPLGLRISLKKMRALRLSLIQKVTELFQPDVFLVDHVPAGIWGELLPTLQMLRKRQNSARVVLGMRDIVDEPGVVRELWRRDETYRVIRNYYDEVLIYGCKNVFDTGAQFGLDVELSGRFTYCGYVCSGEPYKTREGMREQLHLVKEKLIVITAGGGRDAYPMFQACIEAYRLLGKGVPLRAILITGPLMPPEDKERLERAASGLNVSVLTQVSNNLDYISAADLVITMAGYNSLVEVLQLRKKALVIPRLGPSAEQIMRAKLFEERGLIDVIYPHELSPKRLAGRLMTDLERDNYPVYDGTIELNGAAQASARLSEILGERVFKAAG